MRKCQIAMSHLVFIILLCSTSIMYFIFRDKENFSHANYTPSLLGQCCNCEHSVADGLP